MAKKSFFTDRLAIDFGSFVLELDGTGTALTADRQLLFDVKDANRTLTLGGDVTLGNAFTTSGNFPLTFTLSGSTTLTLPTSGTLTTTGSNTFTGNQTISVAGSTSSASLIFSGTTNNWIDFSTIGSAPPSLTTRSVGTKLVLWNNISGSTLDYGLGVESANMWLSSGGGFKWYSNSTTPTMTLTSTGALSTLGALTMGTGMAGQNNYLTIGDPGVGFGNGFNFTRSTDGAGINVIETASDQTMYEFWMSDNPDGGDMMQWRWTDWQSPQGLVVPLQATGKIIRLIGERTDLYTPITQATGGYFTTSNVGGTGGADKQQIISAPNKLRTVGSTIDITNLNTSNYNSTNGALFWIQIEAGGTTFKWGYGQPGTTATATAVPLATSVTLTNGIVVTFSATTGTAGDTWAARVYKTPTNTLSSTTITGSLNVSSTINATNATANAQTVNLTQATDPLFKLVAANGVATNNSGDSVATLGIRYNGSGTLASGLSFIRGASQTDSYVDFWTNSSFQTRLTNAGRWLMGSTGDDGVNRLQVSGGASISGALTAGGPLYLNGTLNGVPGGGAVYGHKFLQSGGATSLSYKLATLPTTGSGTYEHVVLEGVFDSAWASNNKTTFKIVLSNRGALTVQYEKGAARTSHIDIYTEADGSISVWAVLDASAFTSMSVNVWGLGSAGTTFYQSPAAATPTGTLSFSTATATPAYHISSGSRLLIGTTTDDGTSRLQVTGTSTTVGKKKNIGASNTTLGGTIILDDNANFDPRIKFYRWQGSAQNFAHMYERLDASGLLNWEKLPTAATAGQESESGTATTLMTLSQAGNLAVTGTVSVNAGKVLSLAGNFSTSGANAITLTTSGATTLTLPTTGTLATTANTVATTGGLAIDISSTDLNNLMSSGLYRGVTMTNAPDQGWWYILSEAHDTSQWALQVAWAYQAGTPATTATTQYKRARVSGTWGSWVKVVDSNSFLDSMPLIMWKRAAKYGTLADLNVSSFSANVLTGPNATIVTNVSTTISTNVGTVGSTAGMIVGAVISGNANIPAATTVTAITSGTTFTMSANATATASAISTTFTQTIAALSLDGFSPALGDRILVKNQATTLQNGIYTVTNTGSSSVAWTLTRAADADAIEELEQAVVNVDLGNQLNGRMFKTNLKPTDTLNSSAVNFYEIPIGAMMQGGRTYLGHDFSTYISLYESKFINPGASTNNPVGSSGNGYLFGMGAGDTASRGFELYGTSSDQLWWRERGSGNWLEAVSTTKAQTLTNKTITGGSHTAATALGFAFGSFDYRFTGGGTALTANRNIQFATGDANRNITLGGDISLANSFTTAGSFALTLTTTGVTNVTLPTSGTLVTTAGSISGSAGSVVNTVTGTNSIELVRGNMADNDQFRILVGGTASNAGFAELATADDGSEPIYVRQYTGTFTTIARTAALLDGSGNTSFPGVLSAATFSGAGTNLTGTAASLSIGGNAATATSATTATNVAGGAANRLVLQTGAGATSFVPAPVTTNTYLKWNGTTIDWASGGGGTAFTVSATAPSTPNVGDMWLYTDNGAVYTYFNDGDSSQWVEFGADFHNGITASALSVVNPVTTAKDGDIRVTAGVVELYANAAWRQIYPAVYS